MNMRNAKRKIGLLLILCMFVSMLPASVWADGSGQLPPTGVPAADSGTETGSVPSDTSGDYVEITQRQLASSTAADVAAPFSLPREAVTDGTFKDKNAGYKFAEDTATLTIYGTGAMDAYDSPDQAPWASYSEGIKKIVIESGITETGKNAFAGCTALTDVEIKSSTTKIDAETFKQCSALTNAECTDVWKYTSGELSILTRDAVKGPTELQWASLKDRVTKVAIESGVDGITADTFKDMDKLTDDIDQRPPVVSYAGAVDSWSGVGDGCGEWGLQAGNDKYLIVTFKDGSLIGKCGNNVYFTFKSADKSLSISGTGNAIENYGHNKGVIYEDGQLKAPWYSVRGLITDLEIPKTITEIGAFAFYSCSKLKKLEISDAIISIGDYAFAECTNLSALKISKDGKDLSIGKYAFWNCKELKNLGSPQTSATNLEAGIPKRVTTIGEAAFRTSGLAYDKKSEAGHIYYEGNKDDWRAINNKGQSPDIRDDKLLVSAKTGDESSYAIVHYMGAKDDDLYYTLTFDGGLGSKNEPPKLEDTKDTITSRIVPKALDTKTVDKKQLQIVAVDTKFKLPDQGKLERPGFYFNGWLCSADNQIYQTGDEYTMPQKDVTFTAQWKLNVPDTGGVIEQFIEQFSDAKNAGRPNYFWEVPQAAASTEPELNKYLYDLVKKRLTTVESNFTAITDIRYRIQLKSFTPAVMGISNMTAGQDGRFSFDIHFTLTQDKKEYTTTASIKGGTITAIEFDKGKTDITYTVSFNPGGGQDSDAQEKPKKYYPGTPLLLPECKYGPPEGSEFKGWKCQIKDVYGIVPDAKLLEELNYRENAEFVMRPADVIFTAQWKQIDKPSNTTNVSPTSSVVTRGDAPRPTKVQNLDALVGNEPRASVVLEAAPVDQTSPEAARIRTASPAREMTFVDLTINKTVNGQTSPITDTNGTLVAITLPFDGKNAENVKVYRDHEGQVDVLTDETRTGERIAVASDSLTIYATKFSVYAIAFDRKANTPDVTPPTPGGTPGGGSSGSSSGSSSNGGSSKPSIRDNGTAKPSNPQSGSGSNAASRQPFNDVPPGAWYYEAATWAYDAKIAKGEGGKRLNPNKLCTRAEMLTFLWRSLGSPDPVGTGKTFTDVPSGTYYTKAVQWAASLKIVKGEGGKRFNPNATVTRAEAITFLYRALGVPSAAVGRFTDVPASAYYAEAVEWAADRDIAKGMGKRSFSPASPCTRAQVLTFLYRSQS